MAAVLTGPALCLGLLAPSASADPAVAVGTSLLPCEARDGGYFCDLNDIASALADLLNPIFKTTCVNPAKDTIACRVNSGDTPFE
ncbi:hypothetical protein ACSNOH_29615 [Streptomyces sp. URMC 127]|uniref:hypothetical protein n=1 Tax=Streptomyces sp. URMC 127 TaxID=3423402 RepID=UPI003F1B5E36